MNLSEFFATHPKVAIAFSGGVDSAYLLYAAWKAGVDVTAYYVQSAFQPQFELEDAKALQQALGVGMRVLPVDILSDATVTANPANRCYYCKKQIFTAILNAAKEDGYRVILDGTNASDDAGDRPGMRALQELEVLSPLRLCGLRKDEIRALSKEAGLSTWDKPAYACLATRIPTGTAITKELLERTERAEGYLTSLGFRDFRVRLLGDSAKIQILNSQFPLFFREKDAILNTLKQTYSAVLLDLEGRG